MKKDMFVDDYTPKNANLINRKMMKLWVWEGREGGNYVEFHAESIGEVGN